MYSRKNVENTQKVWARKCCCGTSLDTTDRGLAQSETKIVFENEKMFVKKPAHKQSEKTRRKRLHKRSFRGWRYRRTYTLAGHALLIAGVEKCAVIKYHGNLFRLELLALDWKSQRKIFLFDFCFRKKIIDDLISRTQKSRASLARNFLPTVYALRILQTISRERVSLQLMNIDSLSPDNRLNGDKGKSSQERVVGRAITFREAVNNDADYSPTPASEKNIFIHEILISEKQLTMRSNVTNRRDFFSVAERNSFTLMSSYADLCNHVGVMPSYLLTRLPCRP